MSKFKLYPAPKDRVKALLLDIETSPIVAYVWGLWNNDVALNQVKTDWHVLSWSAKWLNDPPSKVMYQDQRNKKNIEDDKEILKNIWKLIDEADVVITQNGIKFDIKKLNARFVLNGMKPTSSVKHIDTHRIAKRHFGFTSNKLEYMTDKLCTKYKKLKHKKYSGFNLWKECLANNIDAWNEMEKYNKYDVLSLEELYNVISPWDKSVNFNLYTNNPNRVACNCGATKFYSKGYRYTTKGKYRRLQCTGCGKEWRESTNLFTKDQRKNINTPE